FFAEAGEAADRHGPCQCANAVLSHFFTRAAREIRDARARRLVAARPGAPHSRTRRQRAAYRKATHPRAEGKMKKTLITLLAIPCLARGIFAQGTSVVPAGDTIRRLSIDSDTSFHPIDLQRAIDLAQANAPAAVQARGQARVAAAEVRQAYAAFLPNATITAGQTQQTGSRIGPTGTIVPFTPPHPWS